jgi:ELWxxDGT repeat protein
MKTSFLHRWSNSFRTARRTGPVSRARRRRQVPGLEALEDRVTMSLVPQMVLDINPVGSSYPSPVVAIGPTTYFSADDGWHGYELWKSDGTAAGTTLVTDLYPGGSAGYYGGYTSNSSNPSDLTNFNGTLFFSADVGGLWKSDGTGAGTVPVSPSVGHAGSLTVVNGTLFFSANDGVHGDELWKSDGTATGTVLVKDIHPGSFGYGPQNLINANGTLFFTADDGTHGRELWRSDGTAAGTTLVKDIDPGSGSSSSSNLTNVNGTLFFTATDGTHGRELWKSAGTAAGTILVKDINPPGASNYAGSYPSFLTNVNGTLYFSAYDGPTGSELWKSDGTAAGTVLFKDISSGSASSSPSDLTNVNGTLFFAAADATNGSELWKSDGTAAGTVLVKDINPGTASSNPSSRADVNGTLFFWADDGTQGSELWKSDGTAAGTVLVTDLYPGIGGSFPASLTNVYGTLFFSADDGIHGTELWKLVVGPTQGTSLKVSGFPTTVTAGVAGAFTVTAKNADGSTNTGYRGQVYFTSSDDAAGLPAAYTFTNADQGVHTFTGTLKSAGLQTLSVWEGTAGASDSANIKVTPAAVSQLSVAGFPSPRPVGAAGVFSVTATDPFGNQVPSYTGTVHFTSADPLATMSAAGLYDAAIAFSATDNPNGVWSYGWSPALGADFVQDTSHRNVAGIDSWMGEQAGDGNPSVTHNGTTDPITPGSMTWQPGQLGFHPGPNGQYAVVRWTAPRAGALSLAAAFSGLDFVGPTTTDVHVLHNNAPLFDGEVLDFGAGPSIATTLAVLAGDTIDFAVGYGRNGTFDCDTTGLDAFISYNDSPLITNYTFTPADAGGHTFSATFGTAGTQSLTATDTAKPSIIGAQQNIDVTAPAARNFVVSGFPSPTTAGTAGTFTVTAKLANGSTAIGYAGTVHFTSSDGQAVLPADYTFTAADAGMHTFSATLRTAGTQSLTAWDVVGASINGTQSAITVKAAAASNFTVTGFPSPVTAGTTGSLTVTARDPFGNRATGYTGAVRFTSSDSKAALPGNYTFTAADAGTHTFSATLKTAGYQSLTATDTVNGALTGAQGSIQVNAAAASRLVMSAPASVNAGAKFSLTITIVDAYGNVVTGYRGKITFRSSDSTAALPKNYTFTAADAGVHTFTGLVLRKKGKQTITVTDTLDGSLTASVPINVQ